MDLDPETVFYDRLIALTTHNYTELEELHKIKTECDNAGINIRNIDTVFSMLSSMQVLNVSTDTIAKIIRTHIMEEAEAKREV